MGAPGRPAYRVTAGQVTDPATGLTWQRASSDPMPVGRAAAYCENLGPGGRSWRLPGVTELATLVDETRVSPAIDAAAFPDTPANWLYWSATVAAPRPAGRWLLTYNDGITTYKDFEVAMVRCVR